MAISPRRHSRLPTRRAQMYGDTSHSYCGTIEGANAGRLHPRFADCCIWSRWAGYRCWLRKRVRSLVSCIACRMIAYRSECTRLPVRIAASRLDVQWTGDKRAISCLSRSNTRPRPPRALTEALILRFLTAISGGRPVIVHRAMGKGIVHRGYDASVARYCMHCYCMSMKNPSAYSNCDDDASSALYFRRCRVDSPPNSDTSAHARHWLTDSRARRERRVLPDPSSIPT